MKSCLTYIFTGLAIWMPLAVSAADLRVGVTRYDGGAAIYGLAENQQLICDNCPNSPDLAPYPPRIAIKFDSPVPVEQTFVTDMPQAHCGPSVLEVEPAGALPANLAVYFGLNEWELNGREKEKIRVALAAGLGPSIAVRVDGYACRIGSEAYNQKLSSRRAKAVAAYLRTLGIKVSSVEGLGEKHQKGAPLSQDRRAEIIIKEGD